MYTYGVSVSERHIFILKSGGTAVSVNDLVLKAAALALRDVPAANASWNDAAAEPGM